jgi:flagellin-like hook-associated protein FlgL
MSINGVGSNTPLAQAILNLTNQVQTLSTQLATGEKSTNYAGLGVNEGFAIAARSQLASISAFTDTISNVGTTISASNNALQSLSSLAGQVQNASAQTPQTLDSNGKTVAQENAGAEFDSIIGILNTPVGDRFLFSGSAINQQATAPADQIINGTATQAGLKQVTAERAVADGTTGTGRLVISSPSTTSISVGEDVAGSPFGLKLNTVSSSLSGGATVTNPAGSPPAVSIAIGATPPNPGDKVSFTFNLPDGTTASIALTATNTSPAPAGSFTINPDPTVTTSNLKAALNSSITTLSGTTLVAASAVAAGDNFFNTAGVATGSVATNQNTTPAPLPITGATALSGIAGTDSISPGFAPGNTITVNTTSITFVAAGTTPGLNQVSVTDSVQTLLTKIDGITHTLTPSTVNNGVVTLNDDAGTLSVASSPSGALAALGFSGTVTGTTASGTGVNNQATTPAPLPITGATALSGAAGTDSISPSFAAGDTITVNGTPIKFVANGATGNEVNVTDSTQTLLSKIDAITGTSTPSTIDGGVVEIHTDDAASLSITSSNTAALGALGFSGGSVTAPVPPLRVGPGSPPTSLVAGTPANTVSWYTGNSGPGSARASSTARIDSSITVQYGVQANESAIRSQLQSIAVFAAFTASPTGTNSAAQISALSQRTATNLTPQPGQQTIEDIQSGLAAAQTVIKDASARQAQSQTILQSLVDNTETVSTQQVATEILALQTQLQASFQTTSIISQLTLTKYLPAA